MKRAPKYVWLWWDCHREKIRIASSRKFAARCTGGCLVAKERGGCRVFGRYVRDAARKKVKP